MKNRSKEEMIIKVQEGIEIEDQGQDHQEIINEIEVERGRRIERGRKVEIEEIDLIIENTRNIQNTRLLHLLDQNLIHLDQNQILDLVQDLNLPLER